MGHFKPRCCDGEAVPLGRNAKALIILKYLLAIIPIGLIALVGAGCQGGEADVKDQGGTPVEENGEPSSEVKQTLGLTAGIIADIQKMQDKIAIRKEAYASTGDTQGEQAMTEAAETVDDMNQTAQDMEEEAQNIATTPEQAALVQANNKKIQEGTERLVDNLKREPDLMEDLQELRTQTDTLDNVLMQIEAEQTALERAGPEQPEQTEQKKAAPQPPIVPPAPAVETLPKVTPAPAEETLPPPKGEPLPPPTGL